MNSFTDRSKEAPKVENQSVWFGPFRISLKRSCCWAAKLLLYVTSSIERKKRGPQRVKKVSLSNSYGMQGPIMDRTIACSQAQDFIVLTGRTNVQFTCRFTGSSSSSSLTAPTKRNATCVTEMIIICGPLHHYDHDGEGMLSNLMSIDCWLVGNGKSKTTVNALRSSSK